MLTPFTIPTGSQVFLGAPAKPMLTDVSSAIGAVVDSVDGVVEAHLPQCFVPGVMVGPAQILVLVFDENADAQGALNRIGAGLDVVFSGGAHIDVWPMGPASPFLRDVRLANCRVGKERASHAQGTKPWWKFWR
jgi:hypothetical protein